MSSEKKRTDVTVVPEPASIKVEIGSPTVMMRIYYSSYHLWAAQRFAELAANIESSPGDEPRFDIEHRAYITSAILSTAAFLEAAINELFKDVVDGHESYVGPVSQDSRKLITAFWNLTEGRNRSPFSILDKYQIFLTLCGKEQLEKGVQPYQDADLVIKLRNELTHYKPTTGGEREHKFARQLPTRFRENPLMTGSGNPYFPDKCLGSPCAGWAAQAALWRHHFVHA